jgi:tetratricopeptide (TPR) repeat protein
LNPLADYSTAEGDFEQVTRLRKYPDAWILIGKARLSRAEYRRRHGEDALGDYDEAEKPFTEAMRIEKELSGLVTYSAYAGRAKVRLSRGICRMDRGQDPGSDFAAAEEDLVEALKINSEDGEAWVLGGNLRLNLALLREREGKVVQARREYAAAVDHYQAALRIDASWDSEIGESLKKAQAKVAELKEP